MLLDIAIPVPLHHPFTYEVPESLRDRVRPGMRVLVPLNRRKVVGVALGPTRDAGHGTRDLKPIFACLDEAPLIRPSLLKLLQWISHYYAAPIGEVCRAALPRPFFQQRKLPASSRLPAPHIGDEAMRRDAPIKLTDAQVSAVKAATTSLDAKVFATFLLHGVTGSGKTEVYLRVIEHTLAAGREAILLVPEIGLTPQLLSRVVARFGDRVAIYHSGLTEAQRVLQWQRMQRGTARICVGTRSALFAPFTRLGCIIVDEEHDASYKQEESPRYHARDTAVMRAREEGAVITLGSATPSLESFRNAEEGKYQYLSLPGRATGVAMPTIEVVDLRSPKTGGKTSTVFSESLFAAMDETLRVGEQILLLFNRRGFAPTLLCRRCGHVFRCPNCAIGLVVHRGAGELRCHYCEYAIPTATACPTCNSARLLPIGAGTERIEQMLRTRFPAARIARFDRDTGGHRKSREAILTRMHRQEIDILIGTQMVAKGHDFPDVGLVGILSADQSLYIPDFRAPERTFQLLTQVAGRTGRGLKQGRVVIQTFTPEHYSLAHTCTMQYDAFVREECQFRRSLGYPPFGRLINVRISGNDEHKVREYACSLAKELRGMLDVRPSSTDSNVGRNSSSRPTSHVLRASAVLGPAPAPLKKLAGKYRWQILIKCNNAAQVPQFTQAAIFHADENSPRGVHVACDVDPINLM